MEGCCESYYLVWLSILLQAWGSGYFQLWLGYTSCFSPKYGRSGDAEEMW